MVRRRAHIACALAAAAAIAGCARAVPPAAHTGPPRVVSLAPSLTEIAFALGCAGLIADTSFDDYPPAARGLPHIADLTNVDLERLISLRPDRVLALHDQEKEGGEIQRSVGVPVVYLPNRSLGDVYADIEGVGAACERTRQATALQAQLRGKIAAIAAMPLAGTRPRVFYLLGLPGFTAGKGTFLDDVIRLAGGSNVAGAIGQPYPNVDAEAIAAMDPDIIVVAKDTPFGADVRSRPPWRGLRAIRDGDVLVPPDDDLMERPGPRIVLGIRWLADAIRARGPIRRGGRTRSPYPGISP